MSRQVAHDFAAAGRVADVHRTPQIKMSGQRRQIVGVVIHVMAVTSLGGSAVAAAVVGDHSIAAVHEEHASVHPSHRPTAASRG